VSLISALRAMVPQGANGDQEALAGVLLERPATPEEAALAHALGLPSDTVHAARLSYEAQGEGLRLDWLRWPVARRGPLPSGLRFAGRSWHPATAGLPTPTVAVWPERWGPAPQLAQAAVPSDPPWQGLYRASAGEHLVILDVANGTGVHVLAISNGSGAGDD
jgi:hypothetical protein